MFWVILLSVGGVISCWFTAIALAKMCTYVRLDTKGAVQVDKWDIKMLPSSRYVLHATYSYVVDGQKFTGDTLLSSLSYPNRYAAEIDLKARKAQVVYVWYQKKNPGFSSLQRSFPKKELLNAILTLGVFCYFYLARGQVLQREKELSEIS